MKKRGGGLPRARLGGAVKGDLLALGRPWEAAEVENVRSSTWGGG